MKPQNVKKFTLNWNCAQGNTKRAYGNVHVETQLQWDRFRCLLQLMMAGRHVSITRRKGSRLAWSSITGNNVLPCIQQGTDAWPNHFIQPRSQMQGFWESTWHSRQLHPRLYLSRPKWQVCKLCSELLRQLEFAKDIEAKSLAHQLPALNHFFWRSRVEHVCHPATLATAIFASAARILSILSRSESSVKESRSKSLAICLHCGSISKVEF